jgi:hypothetical protein
MAFKDLIEITINSSTLFKIGFTPDIRNHPAINYYKSGIPIVIAGDDPGSFGSNELTVDYYMAFMAWGLTLYDLREIANNSIRYSSISDSGKVIGFKKFQDNWSSFIDKMYAQICSNVNTSLEISTTNVYPSYGPNDKSTDIIIYGYGYENLLCKQIKCYFNQTITYGRLSKLNELVCPTPVNFAANTFVNVSVGVDDLVVNKGLTFKFAYIPSTPDIVSFGSKICGKFELILILIISFLF